MTKFGSARTGAIASVILLLAAAQTGNAANPSPGDHPKTATCMISEDSTGTKNYAVFYLSGFGSDGSAYHRTISAPIFELTVKSDGSIDSNASPCKDEAQFQR